MTGSTTSLNPFATRLGDLGSEYCAWQAPSDLVARLADAMDNVRMGFRKAFFDAEQGIVMLMAPSFDHEATGANIGSAVGDLCKAAGVRRLIIGSTRLRLPNEPKNTGVEPDCAFYIGASAEAYYALNDGGDDVAERRRQFLMDTPPDLVVEVETTHMDTAKMKRYQALGVQEIWQTQGTALNHTIAVTMFALGEDGYAQVAASPALGLAPDAVSHILNIPSELEIDCEQAVLEAADTVRLHAASLRQDTDAGLMP